MKAGFHNDRLAVSARSVLLLILVFGATCFGRAQTEPPSSTAASAPATAASAVGTKSASVSTDVQKTPAPTIAAPAQTSASPHLVAKSGPPIDETNRKTLEENAGADAASILMRSSPPGAQIYINGAFVGNAPLLLSVAPGSYKVSMRDQHDDSAERTIGLLAKETQSVTLTLSSRYPNHVSIR